MDYEKCCFILNACRFSLSILFSVADQSGSAENDNTQQHHISLASELLSLRVTTEGNGRRVNMVYGHPKVRICLYIFLKNYCGVVIHFQNTSDCSRGFHCDSVILLFESVHNHINISVPLLIRRLLF